MSRNASKKRGAQPRQSSGGHSGKSWVFFVGGLSLGLLLAAGVYLLKILPTAMELRDRASAAEVACADTDGKKPSDNGSNVTDKANSKTGSEKPVTFEFYSMLPKQEVIAPAIGDKTTTATPPPLPTSNGKLQDAKTQKTGASGTDDGRFVLQAGSFRTRAEADRRRAELVLSGHNVAVQDVTTSKGDSWFRVMVGPFGNETDMQKARQQLTDMKVDTLPVRLK